MKKPSFTKSVFINCPFDEEYSPLLEAMIFCCVYAGFHPRLANVRLDNGENRFDKISSLIRSSMYSIHDLSRCKAAKKGAFLRMNMPFECGLDFGLRNSNVGQLGKKKFLIFEQKKYDLKKLLSDIAGQDPEFHDDNFQILISKVRNFFSVERELALAGPSKIVADYISFQTWLIEKKIAKGHSEIEALNLPTKERIAEMQEWVMLNIPR